MIAYIDDGCLADHRSHKRSNADADHQLKDLRSVSAYKDIRISRLALSTRLFTALIAFDFWIFSSLHYYFCIMATAAGGAIGPPVMNQNDGPEPFSPMEVFGQESEATFDETGLQEDIADPSDAAEPEDGPGPGAARDNECPPQTGGPAKRPPGGGSSPAVSGKAPKAKAPSDGVAVAFKNRVMVIYVNYAGELSYLESPSSDEQSAKSPKEYTKKPVLLSSAKNPAGDRITCRSQTGTSQTKLPRVASVAWGGDADERVSSS